MKFNRSGNWAPAGIPIYNVVISKPLHGYPMGATIQVVESMHPSFKDHWQILRQESLMIKKQYAKIIL